MLRRCARHIPPKSRFCVFRTGQTLAVVLLLLGGASSCGGDSERATGSTVGTGGETPGTAGAAGADASNTAGAGNTLASGGSSGAAGAGVALGAGGTAGTGGIASNTGGMAEGGAAQGGAGHGGGAGSDSSRPDPVCSSSTGNCDGDPENGCEVYVRTDAENCGRCGRACASGECRDGECVPLVLVPDLDSPSDMVLDSGWLYWVTHSGTVGKASAAEGTSEILASGEFDARAIAFHDGNVYWAGGFPNLDTQQGFVASVPADGGSMTVLVDGLTYPADISVSTAGVFWPDHFDSAVWAWDSENGARTVV